MRPTSIYNDYTAVGSGKWMPVDWRPHGDATINVTLDATAALTYKVQYTIDPINVDPDTVQLSRTTTTLTVTDDNHGLSVGDSVIFIDSDYKGTYDVASVVDVNTYTLTVPAAGTSGTAKRIKLRVFDDATLTGKTANAEASNSNPVTAVRTHVTALTTAGRVTLTYLHHSLM